MAPGVPVPPHPGPHPVTKQESAPGIDLRPGTPWAAGLRRAAWQRAWWAAADAEVLTRPIEAGLQVLPVPVYCTPAHQYPLGATLLASRRLALVAWARQRAAGVLEDD